MVRCHHVLVLKMSLAATSVLVTGCSETEQATPRVTFESTVAPGTNCDTTGTFVTIGSFGNPAASQPVRPVDDGAEDQQGRVAVTCSVTPSNNGFLVAASTELTGATGGLFRINGFFRPDGEQSNIDVALTSRQGRYLQKDCLVRYTAPLQGVAAGRVWGEVSCNNAVDSSRDRNGQPVSCNAVAQFRFENCAQ